MKVVFGVGIISLCLISQTASQKTRIVFHTIKPLVTARIDPVVNPGVVAQHSHHIVGGSQFSQVYNPDTLRKSKCTTLGVQADLSNYWQPQILQILPNGSYVAMHTNTRIYYEQPKTKPRVSIEPFPYDFRMLAGESNRKTIDHKNQGNILQIYYCEMHNRDGTIKSKKETHELPKEPCSIMVAKTWFPTCWNGKAYDNAKPSAHVKYPKFGGGFLGAECPDGYGRRFMSIQMETFYWRRTDVPAPPGGKAQYIVSPPYSIFASIWDHIRTESGYEQLANGDTTGYGLHADFTNGWDIAVLKKMINTCKTGPVEEPPEQACAALKPSASRGKGDACSYENKIPDEEIGKNYALSYLPGCNLPWSSGDKPKCNRKTFKGDPGWIKPAAGTVWP